jgi:hypothetical protein
MTSTSLSLRPASAVDASALATLAALDETAPLAQPVLMAFADGDPVAAMSLADGRVAADPFARTTDAVDLLRLRAEQQRRSGRAARRLWLGRPGRLVTG